MDLSLSKVKTVLQGLKLVARFESLGIKKLNIDQKYSNFFMMFGEEIERIKSVRRFRWS